jgi:hypothetical protein
MLVTYTQPKGIYPIDLVESVHVQLPNKTRKLLGRDKRKCRGLHMVEVILTLLCLKWEPRMLRLNSPTLDTTKLYVEGTQSVLF